MTYYIKWFISISIGLLAAAIGWVFGLNMTTGISIMALIIATMPINIPVFLIAGQIPKKDVDSGPNKLNN